MTETEKEYAKANNWIIFRGDYPLTEAMNGVFRKDWLRECDIENLFAPPENMLTDVGKVVLPRLIFVRDVLGIALSYEILIQVFEKIKIDKSSTDEALLHFQLKEAVGKEDYETAANLQEQISCLKT